MDPLVNQLFLTRPESKEELYQWIKHFLKIRLTTEPLCEEHNAQMDWMWHAFQDLGDSVLLANRGGGKTMMGGISTIADSVHKPGCETRIVGGCVLPETWIFTAGGLKQIQHIKVGEYVLTKSGLRRVKRVTVRGHEGLLMHIHPTRGLSFGITPEHPLWVMESGPCMVSNHPCRPDCKRYEKCKFKSGIELKWIRAGAINPSQHWLAISKNVIGESNPDSLGVPGPHDNWYETAGMFLGSRDDYTKSQINLSFIRAVGDAEREAIWRKRVISNCKILFNGKPMFFKKIYTVINREYTKYTAKLRVKDFDAHFLKMGKLWKERSLPIQLLASPIRCLEQLIRGICLSAANDNARSSPRIRISCYNKRILGQLYLIFMKLGYLPTVQAPRHKVAYWRLILPKTEATKLYRELRLSTLTPCHEKKESSIRSKILHKNPNVFSDDDNYYVSIHRVEADQDFKGNVHNLEMEGDDPSYCGPSVTFHNSIEQAERMYEYTYVWEREYFDTIVDGRPFKKETRLKNQSRFKILAQSPKSVRGPHVQKLKVDEADEFSPRVWRAIQFCTESSENVAGTMQILSTLHKSGGVMSEALYTAEEHNIPIFKYCILDVMEPCVPKRKCQRKDDKWCLLYPECRGRLKKRTQGFYRINDAIMHKTRMPDDVWEVEALLKRPDTSNLVYPAFTRQTHVYPDIPYNMNWPTYRAMDFGTTDPFVILYLQVGSDNVVWLIDSIYLPPLAPSEAAQRILEYEKDNLVPEPLMTYGDPSGASWRKELYLVGIHVIGVHTTKDEGVKFGRELMKINPLDNEPRFRVCARNRQFISETESYTKKKFMQGGPDDHGPDAFRYFAVHFGKTNYIGPAILLSDDEQEKKKRSPFQIKRPSRRTYDASQAFKDFTNIRRRGNK